MNYDLWGYINTGGLKIPSIKKQVSENSTFRILANLVWHCNEQDNNEVYVGCIAQAIETKMGRSTVLLARKALTQAGWYINTGEKKLYGAWVYRLAIPGFNEWLGLNSQTTYKQTTGTNSQTNKTNVGLSSGLDSGLSSGLNTGLSNGLDSGLSNGAISQPKTELNQINKNETKIKIQQFEKNEPKNNQTNEHNLSVIPENVREKINQSKRRRGIIGETSLGDALQTELKNIMPPNDQSEEPF